MDPEEGDAFPVSQWVCRKPKRRYDPATKKRFGYRGRAFLITRRVSNCN